MGSRVKCQHCWKVFEVPEDQVNKQRQCTFCQRMTIAKAIEGSESSQTRKLEQAMLPKETADKARSPWQLSLYLAIGLVVLLLMQMVVLLRMRMRSEDATLASRPPWAESLDNELIKLQGNTQKLSKTMKDPKSKGSIRSEDLSTYLEGEVGPGLVLLANRSEKLKMEIEVLEKELQKVQADLKNIQSLQESLLTDLKQEK